jgi:hypothetical protein
MCCVHQYVHCRASRNCILGFLECVHDPTICLKGWGSPPTTATRDVRQVDILLWWCLLGSLQANHVGASLVQELRRLRLLGAV